MGFELSLLRGRVFGIIPAQHGDHNGGQRNAGIGQRTGNVRGSHPTAGKLSLGGVMNSHQTAQEKNNLLIRGEGVKIHFIKGYPGK